MRHTDDGDWKARRLGTQFTIISGDLHIATVLKRHERGSSMYDAAETRANACVIAAAPNLLNSLKELFPVSLFALPKRNHEGACGPEAGCDASCQDLATLAEILKRARAAIAKAEDQ